MVHYHLKIQTDAYRDKFKYFSAEEERNKWCVRVPNISFQEQLKLHKVLVEAQDGEESDNESDVEDFVKEEVKSQITENLNWKNVNQNQKNVNWNPKIVNWNWKNLILVNYYEPGYEHENKMAREKK